MLPADKRNATVVMDTEKYNTKTEELLADPVYEVLERNPLPAFIKDTNDLISKSNLT